MQGDIDKAQRVLEMFFCLNKGERLQKSKEVKRYGVSGKTISRDMETIKQFLASLVHDGVICELCDNKRGTYWLERNLGTLTKENVFFLCIVLIDSRVYSKADLEEQIDVLLNISLSKDDAKMIKSLIQNKLEHYSEIQYYKKNLDGSKLIKKRLLEIGEAIYYHKYIVIDYKRKKKVVRRKLRPATVMYQEFYLYFAGFIDDENVRKNFEDPSDTYPTIYRLDRIEKFRVLEEKFKVDTSPNRFQDGEFRKRIPFMYGGKLQKTKFTCQRDDVEMILDKFPTAEIKCESDDVYTICIETFGRKGVDIWMRSMGDAVKECKEENGDEQKR